MDHGWPEVARSVTPPLVEFGGRGPVLALAVANGFPPECYQPMLAPLLDRVRAVCLPPRALWPGAGAPPGRPGTWESLAEDLAAGLDAHGLRDVIAVGHSFGGVAWTIAATRHPGRVRALALLDPTVFPPDEMAALAADREAGRELRFRLVDAARRRRRRFSSPLAAFAYWRERPLFEDWPDASLWCYVDGMLRPAADGEGLELRWNPEWEAWYYRSFYPHAWQDLARLTPATPLLVVRGTASDTFRREAAEGVAALAPWGMHRAVPGGHLFPQSHPAEAAATLCDFLTSLSPTV